MQAFLKFENIVTDSQVDEHNQHLLNEPEGHYIEPFAIHKSNLPYQNAQSIISGEDNVGYVDIKQHDKIVEIYKIYIFTCYRGKGIGRKAVQALLEQFKAEGFEEVWVESLGGQVDHFWTELDFKSLDPTWENNRHFTKNL